MKQRRVNAVQPRRAVGHQVVVEPDRGADLQHLRRRDPRLRHPPLHAEFTQPFRVDLVGLRPPLHPVDPHRRLRRVGEMRRHTRRAALLDDEPPPRAALHHHVNMLTRELLEPTPERLPVRRRQLPALALTGVDINPIERDLGAVNVEPAYDRHETSSSTIRNIRPDSSGPTLLLSPRRSLGVTFHLFTTSAGCPTWFRAEPQVREQVAEYRAVLQG